MECNNKCPWLRGSIAPVPATSEMTHPVGVRNGQLFTTPTGGVPPVTDEDNGMLAEVVNGSWQKTRNIPDRLYTAEQLLIQHSTRILALENRVNEIYVALTELLSIMQDIERGDVQ